MVNNSVPDLRPGSSYAVQEKQEWHTPTNKELSRDECSLERETGVSQTKRQKQLTS